MWPFMMEIDAARRAPLDQLALDYLSRRFERPSLDFCRCACGVQEEDVVVARRLGVATALVRTWREIGRRASGGAVAASGFQCR
jgi:hypothetical protein